MHSRKNIKPQCKSCLNSSYNKSSSSEEQEGKFEQRRNKNNHCSNSEYHFVLPNIDCVTGVTLNAVDNGFHNKAVTIGENSYFEET